MPTEFFNRFDDCSHDDVGGELRGKTFRVLRVYEPLFQGAKPWQEIGPTFVIRNVDGVLCDAWADEVCELDIEGDLDEMFELSRGPP